MALEKSHLPRVFVIDKTNKELEDPNPSMTPDQVMNFYSSHHPELTTSTVHGPQIKGDKLEFRFKSTVGTKA